jgi:hypothetical protein
MKGFVVSVESKSEYNIPNDLLCQIIAGEEENAVRY